MVRVVVKEVGKPGVTGNIGGKLDCYKKLVGGYIEAVPLPVDNSIYVVLNEEGKLKGMPANIRCPEYNDIFVGTVVFVGVGYVDGGDRDFISLTDEQVLTVISYIFANSVVRLPYHETSYDI